MVAIVSGNSLGLGLTSSTTLNRDGITGSAALGSSGENGYVNLANGNFVLQDRDDFVAGQGLDIATVRTYNSQGALDAANGSWHIGFYRSIVNMVGTFSDAGSSVTRIDADGAEAVYNWDGYRYINYEGGDAADILTFANGGWTWTDGSTRTTEKYDWINGRGKLLTQADSSNNKLTYNYRGDQLAEVVDQDGEKTVLDYTDGKLSSVHTVRQDGSISTRVRYAYDAQGRLSSVTLDLSPDDNSVADGKAYVTTYGYDGGSQRINSVHQSDGTQLYIDYTEFHGNWRVRSLRQLADGVERTTTYDYADLNNTVSATADVDGHQLSTIGDVSTVNAAPLDLGKAVTSETQTSNKSAGLDRSKLTTDTLHSTAGAGLSAALLSTTESETAPKYAELNSSKVSNIENRDVEHTVSLNGSQLSTVDTPVKDRTANLDASKLVSTEPDTVAASANLDSGKLSADGAYEIQAGDSWTSITQSLYGSRDSEAAAALAAALGSPALTAGTSLAQLPATLNYTKLTGSHSVAPYYEIKSGDTWSDVCLALYGTSEQSAIDGLKAALANPSLLPGARLTGLPASLQYGVAVAVPPYVRIRPGETWASLAGTLYGVWSSSDSGDAAAALRQALGNPVLVAGEKLAGLPATLAYTTHTVTVPSYYRIQAGDSWDSITQTLYSTNDPAAVSALRTYLHDPALVAGAELAGMPNLLDYTTDRVPPYYRIKVLDTWASITKYLYGTDDTKAVAALQTALGNPELVAGAKLTNLPSQVSWPITVQSAPYYRLAAGETWASITLALYHTSEPDAVRALQTGRYFPEASGTLYELPAMISFEVVANVAVPPYYQVQAGDTWASITQALYGTGLDAAQMALQKALGYPPLRTGDRLVNLPAPLEYLTTAANMDVPPYYQVKPNDSWETIAATLYGTANAGAVKALRDLLGDPSLSAGLHLQNLPAKLLYAQASLIGAQTRVRDALGNVTSFTSDAQGRLTRIQGPAMANGSSPSVAYTYDANGNVLTQVDGLGNVTTYSYDNWGNQLNATDALGSVTTRVFGSANQLLSESVSFSVADGTSSRRQLTSFLVYDPSNRLRFMIDREGGVSEYRYNALGQRTSAITYTGAVFTGSSQPAESDMLNWVNAADKSRSMRSDTQYDFRGQAAQVTKWSALDSSGNGIADGTQSVTQFVYDQAGNLLSTVGPDKGATTYTYDGMGRVLNTVDPSHAVTSNTYDDAGHHVITRMDNGLLVTSAYNQAGQLISRLQSDGNRILGESKYWYDPDGRLRLTQAPDGSKSALLYDAAGRKTGEISASGGLTEYVYDANNRLVHTIAYAKPVLASLLVPSGMDLGLAANQVALQRALGWTVDALRPEAGTQDVKSWNFYDRVGRLCWQVDGMGYVTQTLYDGASHAYAVNRLATPVDVSQLGNGIGVALNLGGTGTSVQLAESRGAAGTRTYTAVVTGLGTANSTSGTVTFFAGTTVLGSAVVRYGVASFTTTLAAGHSEVSAVYSGDSANAGSTSNTIAADVAPAPATTTTLAVDMAASRFGSAVVLTATVNGAAPGGIVAFYSGRNAIGYGVLANGAATLAVNKLPVGDNQLTAVYLGDTGNSGSTSSVVAESVQPAQASISIRTSKAATRSGAAVTLSANVSGQNPQGSVVFYDLAGAQLGTVNLINGYGELVVPNLPAGAEQVMAIYSGDANNASATSAVLNEQVDRATSHTTVFVERSVTSFGAVVSVCAQVTGFNPTGSVNFFDKARNLIGTAKLVNGQALLSLPDNGQILGNVTVTYAGDADNLTSIGDVTDTPRAATTMRAVYSSRECEITVSGIGKPSGSVALYDRHGAQLQTVPIDANGYVRVNLSSNIFPDGTSVLTVVYGGDANNAASVTTFNVNVWSPMASLNLTMADNTYVVPGQYKVVTAKLDAGSGRPVPTGTVKFTDQETGIVLANVQLVNGMAAYAVQVQWTSGYHVIRADYAGDDFAAAAYAQSVYVRAASAPPVKPGISLASNLDTVAQGGQVTLTASLTGGTTSGNTNYSVVFMSGTTYLGTVAVANNAASLTTTLKDAGTAPIRAVAVLNTYNGNSDKHYSLSEETVADQVGVTVTPNAQYVAPVDTRVPTSASMHVESDASTVSEVGRDKDVMLVATFTSDQTGGPVRMASFYNGGQLIGTAYVSNNTARLLLGPIPSGTHSFTVSVSGDDKARPATSAPQPFKVNTVATSSALIAMPAAGGPGNRYNLLAQVSSVLPTNGRVRFFNGDQVLGEVALNANLAALTVDLAPGQTQLRADYLGDALGSASSSNVLTPYLNGKPADIVLNASSFSSAVGAPLVLSAQVTGKLASGTVSFFNGNSLLGSANLIGGVAKLTVGNLQLGSQQLVAVYSGDTINGAATSAAITETVVRASAPLVLTVSRQEANASTNAPAILRATFDDATPGGIVTFMSGDTVLGTAAISDGKAELALARLPAGSNALRAVYAGDGQHTAQVSDIVKVEVAPVVSRVQLTVSGSMVYGDQLVLTAKVDGDHPGGTVLFHNGIVGNRPLGEAQVIDGVATLVISNVQSMSTLQFNALYVGDAYHSTSASLPVTKTITVAPTSVTLSADATTIAPGQPAILMAAVPFIGSEYPAGTVYFYDKGVQIAYAYVSVASGIAQVAYRGLAAGAHDITARFSSNSSTFANSPLTAPMRITVAGPAPSTTTLTSPGSNAAIGPNLDITLQASVGGIAPTGLVTFISREEGGPGPAAPRVLGSANVVNGVASLTISGKQFARETDRSYIVAVYAGDAANLGSSSTFNYWAYTPRFSSPPPDPRPQTTAVLSGSADGMPHGSAMVLTTTIGGTNGATATGTVTIFNGVEVIGNVPVVNGVAQFTTIALPVASNTLTAVYSGDANNAGSVSGVIVRRPQAAIVDNEIEFKVSTSPLTQDGYALISPRLTGAHRDGSMRVYIDGNYISSENIVDGVDNSGILGLSRYGRDFGAPGLHTVRVEFAGVNGSAVGSKELTIKTLARPALELGVSSNKAISGSSVTLTARVNGINPTGKVIFWTTAAYGVRSAYVAPVVNGVAALSLDNFVGDVLSWSAKYCGDENNATAYADTNDRLEVQPVSTVISVKSEIVTTPTGSLQRLTARITGAGPTGLVTFFDQYGRVLGVAAVRETEAPSESAATLVLDNVLDGRACVQASYSGDSRNTISIFSLVDAITTPSTVSLSSSNTLPRNGQPVTLSARVAGAQPGGVVVFLDAAGRNLGRADVVDGIAALTLSQLPAGKNSITAQYLGDDHNAFSVGSFVQEVAQAQTHVTLLTSQSTCVQGKPLILTASVSRDTAGYASGTVTFYNGASIIGTGTLINGIAAITVSNLAAGNNALTVRYAGDGNSQASAAEPINYAIIPAQLPTSVTLTTSAYGNVSQGTIITLIAKVSGQAGIAPTGIATFFLGNKVLCTAPVVNGIAQLQYTAALVAYSSVNVAYSGDTANASSVSEHGAYLNITQNSSAVLPPPKTPSLVTLTASRTSSTYGDPVTFRAQVTGQNGMPVGGMVSFIISGGGEVVASALVKDGVATWTTNELSGGVSISAAYSGDDNNAPTTTSYVNVNISQTRITPELTLSTDRNRYGDTIRLVARVPHAPGNLDGVGKQGYIDFYRGTTKLGYRFLNDGVAYLDVSTNWADENSSFTAVYNGKDMVQSSASVSAPVQLVTESLTALPVKLSVSPLSPMRGEAVTLTASVKNDVGGVYTTGTFSFYNGSQLLGSVSAQGNASLTLNNLPQGANQLRVVYSGSAADHLQSLVSAVIPLTVQKPQPSINTVNATQQDGRGAFSATFTVSGGTPMPTGSVSLFANGNDVRLGSGQLVNGQVVIAVEPGLLTPGVYGADYHFRIVYSGDDNYAPCTSFGWPSYTPTQSGSLTLTSVPAANGQIELVAKLAGGNPGGSVTFKDQYGNVLGTVAVNADQARLTVIRVLGDLSGVQAFYTGDAYNSPLTANYTANADATKPATRTVLSTSQDALAQGAMVTLTANVSGAGVTPSGAVNFYDGTVLLGTAALANGAASLTTATLAAGLNRITAVYVGDGGNAGSISASREETVVGAPVTVLASGAGMPVKQGGPLTLVAAVNGKQPCGVVTFISGKTVLGTATLVNGVATLQLANVQLPVGENTIIASYAGDRANQATVSVAFKQVVQAGSKQIAVVRNANDRKDLQLFDKNGLLRGHIDGEGFLTEYRYDAAQRLVQTIAYATAVTPKTVDMVSDSADLFADAVPLPAASAADIQTFYYYDKQGRKAGEVNGEGYLTEYGYDVNGRLAQTTRYANKARTPVAATATLDALRPTATAEDHVVANTWNQLGQLASQTNVDGSITSYSYDSVGGVTSTVVAKGSSDQRTLLKRYDLQGRLAAELSGVGAALITGDMSPAQVDAIWAANATTYTYDPTGLRTSVTDAQGHRSVFYYDDAGRPRFTVNAEGNVAEMEYDAIGRTSAATKYAASIAADVLPRLSGGLLSSAASAEAVQILAQARQAGAGQNSTTKYVYDNNNALVQTSGPGGSVSSVSYNAFGEVATSSEATDAAGHSLSTVHSYDHRGLETGTNTLQEKVYFAASAKYDAFGRLVRSVDVNGNVRLQNLDKLGRVIQTTDPTSGVHGATYDAFDRVLTRTDANSRTTTYSYNTAQRSTTVTSPELVSMTTTLTRNGQTQSIRDGNGNLVSYSYDQDGNLLAVDGPLADTSNIYDSADRLIKTIDANGNAVSYTYDSANCVLTSTVDVAGAKLVTRYEYDGKGQRIKVTDANGNVTRTEYDVAGQVMTQTVDAGGLNLVTRYTHDVRGNTLTVTSAGGTTTKYVYDELGRRIQTIADPDGLKLTENYAYDNKGNVTSHADVMGNVTRYAYDGNDRLVYTIDPMGFISKNAYDAEGHVTSVIRFAKPAALAGVSLNPTVAQMDALAGAVTAKDTVQYHVYNKDGQLTWDVDALGGVTQYSYNGNGNIILRRTYVTRIDMTKWVVGSVPAVTRDASRDGELRTVYDAQNRPAYAIDGTGHVTALKYDGQGNVTERIAYANTIPVATEATAAAVAVALAMVADATRDQHTRNSYDGANRLQWSVDGNGQVSGYTCDGNGNVAKKVIYANHIAADAQPASVQAAVGDHTVLMCYDADNRLAFQVDGEGAASKFTYDSSGNLVQTTAYAKPLTRPTAASTVLSAADAAALVQADSAGHIVRKVYDILNREIYSIDSTGAVTESRYDGNGHVTEKIAYAKAIPTSTAATSTAVAAALAQVADASRDAHMRYAYDLDGRLLWSTDASGAVTGYAYNHLGEVVRRTVYAARFAASLGADFAAALSAAVSGAANAQRDHCDIRVFDRMGNLLWEVQGEGAVTQFRYDGKGNQIEQIRYATPMDLATYVPGTDISSWTSNERDVHQYQVFDAQNRVTWSIDSKGDATHISYDGEGNVVARITYATPIDMTKWTVGTDPAVVADLARDNVIRTVYDADGLPRYAIDGMGQVTGMKYDSANNVVERSIYAKRIPTATAASLAAVEGALAKDPVNDLRSQYVYDANNRVVMEADSTGQICAYAYDSFGNTVRKVLYTQRLAPGSDIGSAQASADDRVTLMGYDSDNRLVSSIDAFGEVSSREYDALGNVVKTVVYANHVAHPSAQDTIALADTVRGDAARDKVLRSVFDSAGNEIFSIDQFGTLTARSFDAYGNVSKAVVYHKTVARNTPATAASLAALAASIADPAQDQWNSTIYDRNGRPTWTADQDGTATSFRYNTSGKLLETATYMHRQLAKEMPLETLKQLLGGPENRNTWSYDAANRLESTAVEILGVSGSASLTTYAYDGIGNETGRKVSNTYGGVVHNSVLHTVYDAQNRAIYTLDLSGNVVAFKYDVRGNVVDQIAYASAVPIAALFSTRVLDDYYGKLGDTLAGTASIVADSATSAANISAAVAGVANASLDVHTRRVYAPDGRLQWEVDSKGLVSSYTYDRHGNLAKLVKYATVLAGSAEPKEVRTSGQENVQLFAYDSEDRLVLSVDGSGRVTRKSYDAYGNLKETVSYHNHAAHPTADSAPLAADAMPVSADPAGDDWVRSVYDASGRTAFRLDSTGTLTHWSYEGNIVIQTSYFKTISTATPATLEALAAAAAVIADARQDGHSSQVFGADGRLMAETNVYGGATRYYYDAAGKLVETVGPNGGSSRQGYDLEGQLIYSADATGHEKVYFYDASHNLVRTQAINKTPGSSGLVTGTIFDAAHRAIWTDYDGNNVAGMRYDARGNVLERVVYADNAGLHDASPIAGPDGKDVPVFHPIVDLARAAASRLAASSKSVYDMRTHDVYDDRNQLIYTEQGGFVTAFTYDEQGNLIKQVQSARKITPGSDPSNVAVDADDRITLNSYDADHHLLLQVNPDGAVIGQSFDAWGNLLTHTEYATPVADVAALAGNWTKTEVRTLIPVGSAAGDRINHYAYDAHGRQVFSVDQSGMVQRIECDGHGNVSARLLFADTLSARVPGGFADFSVAGPEAYFKTAGANDRKVSITYDVSGQVRSATDALGATEYTTYNSLGLKATFTDKEGFLWQTFYDNAGRVTSEVSPALDGKNSKFNSVTTYVYDGLGNLVSRTVGMSRAADNEGRDESSVQFHYDWAGRKVGESSQEMVNWVADKPGIPAHWDSKRYRKDAPFNLLGQMISATGTDGTVTEKLYDESGQLKYEIDNLGFVTIYARNAFGDIVSLTRCAQGIDRSAFGPGTLDSRALAQKLSAMDHSHDRVIISQVDKMGRTLESASYMSDAAGQQYTAVSTKLINHYDAFGNLQYAISVDPVSGEQQVEATWYNAHGQVIATVDKAGFMTGYQYDNFGNKVAVTESAFAIQGWKGDYAPMPVPPQDAHDRITTYEYDLNQHMTKESLNDREHLGVPDCAHVKINVFDKKGNVILANSWGPGQSGSNSPTIMTYDGMGHATAVLDGTRPNADGYALTTYIYGAGGHAIETMQYAKGKLVDGKLVASDPNSAENRRTRIDNDDAGRPIHTVDAEGAEHFISYDASGNKTGEYAVGAALAPSYTQPLIRTYVNGRLSTDSDEGLTLKYNAFGELIYKKQGDQEFNYEYDDAGHLWRSNESGHVQVYLYDLNGQRIALLESGGKSNGNCDLSQVNSADEAARASGVRRTDYSYDSEGHCIREVQPMRQGQRPESTKLYDHWGNVLKETRSAVAGQPAPTAIYTYDLKNRKLTESHTKADGTAGGRVREYSYALGERGVVASRQTIDREGAAVSGPQDNDALHARYRVIVENYTATGQLLSSTVNGIKSYSRIWCTG